jgi:hypothetical protein
VNKHIRYSITTWQETHDQKWRWIIRKFVRTTFKRSGRTGWHYMGFVKTGHEGQTFDNRAEALANAQAARNDLRQPSI